MGTIKTTVDGFVSVRRIELEGTPADVQDVMSRLGLEPRSNTVVQTGPPLNSKPAAAPKASEPAQIKSALPKQQTRNKVAQPVPEPEEVEHDDVDTSDVDTSDVDIVALKECKRLKHLAAHLRTENNMDNDAITATLIKLREEIPLLQRLGGDLAERIGTAIEMLDAEA